MLSAVIEIVAGARGLRTDDLIACSHAREALFVGILSAVLAVALVMVPSGYALQYYIEDAGQSFTLTGITIAVGIFGAYAAIVAVYLAIAGFSPRKVGATEDRFNVIGTYGGLGLGKNLLFKEG